MNISHKIKQEMQRRKITAPELTEITNIPQVTLQNILRGRSKKTEHLQKIADALDLPLEYLLNDSLTDITSKIDLDRYYDAVSITFKLLKNRNLKVTRKYLEELIYNLYAYSIQNQGDKSIYTAYIEGLLQKDIDLNKLR